jgi:hypothetical protein
LIETRIVLIDGPELAKLMIAHGVGVTPVAVYELKRVDSDYFTQAAVGNLRNAKGCGWRARQDSNLRPSA